MIAANLLIFISVGFRLTTVFVVIFAVSVIFFLRSKSPILMSSYGWKPLSESNGAEGGIS